jgi:hypothetical protein
MSNNMDTSNLRYIVRFKEESFHDNFTYMFDFWFAYDHDDNKLFRPIGKSYDPRIKGWWIHMQVMLKE